MKLFGSPVFSTLRASRSTGQQEKVKDSQQAATPTVPTLEELIEKAWGDYLARTSWMFRVAGKNIGKVHTLRLPEGIMPYRFKELHTLKGKVRLFVLPCGARPGCIVRVEFLEADSGE
jgi:hypothetical protein